MRKLFLFLLVPLPFLIIFLVIFFGHQTFDLLSPQGSIGLQEKNLMLLAIFLMLSLAIPVVLMAYFVMWKYRSTNNNATYMPEWTGNKKIKLLWWLLPGTVIGIIAVLVYKGAHSLDPYKPISSQTPPITIEVVALNWKWLFIYPQENIATINFIEFPVKTPVNFYLTADAPMNSFWIPRLGGQMYAMAAMETKLHLIADKIGDYAGGPAEINGDGFSGMRFTARASSQDDFNAWVAAVKKSKNILSRSTYDQLVKPSEYVSPILYASVDSNLYNDIIAKYMNPPGVKMDH